MEYEMYQDEDVICKKGNEANVLYLIISGSLLTRRSLLISYHHLSLRLLLLPPERHPKNDKLTKRMNPSPFLLRSHQNLSPRFQMFSLIRSICPLSFLLL